jgi:WD40 repeat protein
MNDSVNAKRLYFRQPIKSLLYLILIVVSNLAFRVMTLDAQDSPTFWVRSVHWSPDGQKIAIVLDWSAEPQSIIRIYDAETLEKD